MRSGDGWMDEDTWGFIQKSVPIPCVDFVPVRRDSSGLIEKVGLILRETPFEARRLWCHLGGRVKIGETLACALRRHARSTLADEPVHFPDDPQPLAVVEWFPAAINPDRDLDAPWRRFGEDPRKHAISMGFIVDAGADIEIRAGGEGLEFRWFAREELGGLALWPGSEKLIGKLIRVDDVARGGGGGSFARG